MAKILRPLVGARPTILSGRPLVHWLPVQRKPRRPPVPTNTAVPTISGTTTQGQTLTAANGTWTGSPTGYAYVWLRNGSAIPGASAQTYVLQAADVGTQISVRVTASNVSGSAQATSAQTAAVASNIQAPTNSTLPTISGTKIEGQTLTATSGTWTNNPTAYAYQWLRNGTAISGATAQTYVLQQADVTTNISVRVTASNSGGSNSATSTAVGPISDSTPPVNTAVPTISGTMTQGSTLTTSNGTWNNSPTSYAYSWIRKGVTESITFDPNRKPNITLSDLNMRATQNQTAWLLGGTTLWPLAKRNSGKWAFEVKVEVAEFSNSLFYGWTREATLADFVTVFDPRSGTNGWAFVTGAEVDKGFILNGSSTGGKFTTGVGSRVQLLFDIDAKKVWATKDAVNYYGVGGPYTRAQVEAGEGGFDVSALGAGPYYPFFSTDGPGYSVTLLVGTPYHALPAGFSMIPSSAVGPDTPIGGATNQTYVLQAADAGRQLQSRVTASNASGSGSASSAFTAAVT